MFRTADAAGIRHIILTGYTPTPFDLLGNVRKEFAKTALGAERGVAWHQQKHIARALKILRERGYSIYAIEDAVGAKNIFMFSGKSPCACIMGNEVNGLSKKIMNQCDATLAIPMRGKKESLNVSVAFGIAAYELKR